jgi:hypothetical protein
MDLGALLRRLGGELDLQHANDGVVAPCDVVRLEQGGRAHDERLNGAAAECA